MSVLHVEAFSVNNHIYMQYSVCACACTDR